jgi:hypothetical protein
MAKRIHMAHDGGMVVDGYKGWSWTCFFFGFLPPLFRGDFRHFVIFFVVHVILGFALFFLFGLANLIFAIVIAANYNEWHRKRLIEKGYKQHL